MIIKKKWIISIALLFLVLLTVSAVSASSFNDVQTAINNPTDGKVFLNNTTYTYERGESVIGINTSNLVIYGGSSVGDDETSTLDGQGLSQIMIVHGKNITFIGINFINGKAVDGGAIWLDYDSNNKWFNCSFNNNTASHDGGAIWLDYGSNNKWFNCSFNNNTASHDGGAIYFYKDLSNNNCWVNCTFNNNTASHDGGAIWFCLTSINNSCVNCTFINNTANTGGAIRFDSGSDNNWVNCTFINNTASYDGGAIDLDLGSDNNWVNCTFINNTASHNGGAICFGPGSGNDWVNCTFINNTARRDGGAIHFDSRFSNNNYWVKCTFINNTANTGGAILFHSGSGNKWLNCTFINNTARSNGGAIYFYYGAEDNLIKYCIFEGNSKSSIVFADNQKNNLCDYNFFAFQDNVTTFPSGLIFGFTPNNWVVLKGYSSGDEYIANFVLNNGSSLPDFMPDYTARLVMDSEEEEIITIENNRFSCEYDSSVNYNVYSLNSGKLLTSLPAKDYTPIVLIVEDIKTLSGSTVKVNVGVLTLKGDSVNGGTVTLSLDGINYVSRVVNGVSSFDIVVPSETGVYSANVFFNGEGTSYANNTCNFTVTTVEDINSTDDIKTASSEVNMKSTGNPLFSLLFALISLPIIRRRK